MRKLDNTNTVQLVLLDHGLYGHIDENVRKNLSKLWKSIVLKDEVKMKFYSKELNVDGNRIFLINFFVLL